MDVEEVFEEELEEEVWLCQLSDELKKRREEVVWRERWRWRYEAEEVLMEKLQECEWLLEKWLRQTVVAGLAWLVCVVLEKVVVLVEGVGGGGGGGRMW